MCRYVYSNIKLLFDNTQDNFIFEY